MISYLLISVNQQTIRAILAMIY